MGYNVEEKNWSFYFMKGAYDGWIVNGGVALLTYLLYLSRSRTK
jgi:hypothetical protein